MRTQVPRRAAILSLVVLVSVLAAFAEGGRATRPPGRGAPSSAAQRGTGGPVRAQGTARYGYNQPRHGHVPYYAPFYQYPYYSPFWFSYAWGSPYWDRGWYGPPPPYGITPPPGELPAAVEIDLRPRRASVTVDGEAVGEARDYSGNWDLLWLAPGEHVIEFTAPGHQTLRRVLSLDGGAYARIDDRLQKGAGLDPRGDSAQVAERPERSQPPPGRGGTLRGLLRLSVEPLDAAVYLDGEFLARADELSRLHGALPVARGVHRIEVVRPGYASESVEIDVASSEPILVSLSLEREN